MYMLLLLTENCTIYHVVVAADGEVCYLQRQQGGVRDLQDPGSAPPQDC